MTTNKIPLRKKIPYLFLLKIGFYLFLLGSIAFAYIVYNLSQDLPDYKQLSEYSPSITSRFYSNDGSLLTEYAKERRTYVQYEQFPKKLIEAFISTEDKKFWTHKGIDIKGIIRSVLVNVKNKVLGANRKLVGASTITQQVSRNFFLSSDQKYERKIKEIILSLKVERTFSKEHIMTLYLNQIYLGARSFGVAAAAKSYFDKGLNELTIPEMAFLAGLPKAPSTYNPVNNKEKALQRRNFVLSRMRDENYISRSEYENYVQEDIEVASTFHSGHGQYSRYFAEEIRRVLTEEYGEEKFYRGGLSVLTTAEPKMQEIGTKILKQSIIDYDRKIGYTKPEKNYDLEKINDLILVNDFTTLSTEFGSSLSEKLKYNNAKIQNLKKQNWEIVLKHDNSFKGMEEWKKAIIISVEASVIQLGLSGGKTGIIKFSDIANLKVDKKLYGVDRVSFKSDFWKNRIFHKGDIIFVEPQENSYNFYDLRQNPQINGGLIAMDPKTGRIFSIVGGFSFRASSFNRVTQSRRQPGSTIKPFVYMAGLETGKYLPNSTLIDAPVVISKGDGEMWKPENYDNKFLGEIPFYVSLWKSRNNPTVRLAKDLGIRRVINMAEKFGVYKDVKSRERNLSLALGSGATTLLNMATAYSQILNGGKKISPTMIDKVQDRDGNNIYIVDKRDCENCSNIEWQEDLLPPEVKDNREQIIDAETAYQMTYIMKGVVEKGSGRKARITGRDIAGKTGTSNDAKDVWFIGGTPDLVVGIYIGYDTPRSLGSGVGGGSICAPIFKKFMDEVIGDTKATTFPVPEGIKFIKLDKNSGNPASYDTPSRDIIIQAFKTSDKIERNNYKPAPKYKGKSSEAYEKSLPKIQKENIDLEEDIY